MNSSCKRGRHKWLYLEPSSQPQRRRCVLCPRVEEKCQPSSPRGYPKWAEVEVQPFEASDHDANED
jgi:hypothetical protein